MRTILVTGAAGFIGSNFVRMLLKRGEDVKLIALDKLTYAGNLANLEDLLDDKRLSFVKADIGDVTAMTKVFEEQGVRQVVHCAAKSNVDRSIMPSRPFVQTSAVAT